MCIRDRFDFALIKAAEEKQIPIFCICRGLQILNVYRGGSLFQDLKYDQNCTIKHSQNQTPSLGTHTVDIESKSKLASAIAVSYTHLDVYKRQPQYIDLEGSQ